MERTSSLGSSPDAKGEQRTSRTTTSRVLPRSTIFQPSVAENTSGWLFKRGHIVKNIKKRWFVLQNKSLAYYQNQAVAAKGGKPKGVIDLSDAVISPISKKDRGFHLKAKVNNKAKEFYLEDVTVESKQLWIDILSKVEGVTLSNKSKEPQWQTDAFLRRNSFDEAVLIQSFGTGILPVVSLGLNKFELGSSAPLDPANFRGKLTCIDIKSDGVQVPLSFHLSKNHIIVEYNATYPGRYAVEVTYKDTTIFSKPKVIDIVTEAIPIAKSNSPSSSPSSPSSYSSSMSPSSPSSKAFSSFKITKSTNYPKCKSGDTVSLSLSFDQKEEKVLGARLVPQLEQTWSLRKPVPVTIAETDKGFDISFSTRAGGKFNLVIYLKFGNAISLEGEILIPETKTCEIIGGILPLQDMKVNQVIDFQIKAQKSFIIGAWDEELLSVFIQGNASVDVVMENVEETDGKDGNVYELYNVCFSAPKPGLYFLNIEYESVPIPGSPLIVNVHGKNDVPMSFEFQKWARWPVGTFVILTGTIGANLVSLERILVSVDDSEYVVKETLTVGSKKSSQTIKKCHAVKSVRKIGHEDLQIGEEKFECWQYDVEYVNGTKELQLLRCNKGLDTMPLVVETENSQYAAKMVFPNEKQNLETILAEFQSNEKPSQTSSICLAVPGLELKTQMQVDGIVDVIEVSNFGMYDDYGSL